MSLHQTAERMWRRVSMVIGFGRSTAPSNESGPVSTAQIQLGPLETRDATRSIQIFGFASAVPVGTDHVVVFVAGDRSNGVAVASNHQTYRPTGMEEGESMQYDTRGQRIYLSTAGIVVNGGGLPVTVENTPSVTINATSEIIANTPVLKCSGDIIDNYSTNPHNMAAMRSIYNEHIHPVPNVQSGTSTVTTNIPTQQE